MSAGLWENRRLLGWFIELGVGVRSHVEDFQFLVVKETYAAFVFDGTGGIARTGMMKDGIGV